MESKLFGVIIETGPQDWQILQQENGFADIYLSGNLYINQSLNGSERILARVLDENTGILVGAPAVTTLNSEKKWELTLKNIPAGGLYRIETLLRYNEICEKVGNRIHHIGVGDVFVIAGQSNAQGIGKDTVYDPVELGIHMFHQSGCWKIASHPFADTTDSVYHEMMELSQVGHSPWLNFARTLKNLLHYPIGLIPTAKGGTPLETWNPEQEGSLYRNMLSMLKDSGNKTRGVLWYQGCNDTDAVKASDYLERFKKVVKHIRKDLDNPDLPIFTVQLNKVTCLKNRLSDSANEWGLIREAQRMAALTIPNVFIIPSIDMTVCDGIHNRACSNLVIGERVAKMALKHIYGYQVLSDAPMITSATYSDDTIIVEFSNVVNRLNTDMIPIERFPIIVEDSIGKIPICDYSNKGNTITLKLTKRLQGKIYLHCAMEQFAYGLLPYDVDSYLPIMPFYRFEVKGAGTDE